MNKFFTQNRSKETALSIYRQRIEDAKIIYDKFADSFIPRPCPYCDSTEYTEEEKFIGLYEVARCSSCSFTYIRLVPNNEALSYYYNECKCNLMLDDLFRKRATKGKKNVVNRGKLNEVMAIIDKVELKDETPLRVLEIGCGSGSFLNLLQESLDERKINYELYGVDLDKNAIAKNANSKVRMSFGGAETFIHDQRFDLIIHFELIEHIINPSRMMGNIFLHLKPNGYCFFSTPNSLGLEIKAIDYNKTRFLAHSIFPPMHINGFNPQNITHFILRNSFKVREIKTPGIFDVSILLSTAELEELDDWVDEMKNLDDATLGTIQKIVSYLYGSSHMTCLIQK